jgi:hypothetical protein
MRVGEFLRIEWRGLAPQAGAEALARREAARLTAWYPDLRVLRVGFEAPGARSSAQQVCASIEVRGWQRQVILNRAHADASTALREAFDAIFRKFDRRERSDRRASRPRKKELRAA